MNNVYCVCTTPNTYGSYVSHWDKFKDTGNELRWLCDITKNKDFKLDFDYTEDDIRKNLNFNKILSTKHYWNSVGNRNIIWFYAHFRMLNFYIQNPEYEYYWFFDDDIKSDNWVEFFKGFENDDSDLISYFIFKNKDVESQNNVPKIDEKTFSNDQWFFRFPGDGDILPKEINELFGSFFPIVKLSNRSMKKLLELNNEGLHGYSEGFVPTMLNHHGMKLNTIIQPNNTSLFFDVNKINILHKNIKVTWEWI